MIPACFKGETIVVIAGGPSLTPEDVNYCQGRARVAVVNDGYRLAPWADLLYAADGPWWDHHEGVPDFSGQKWTQDKPSAKKYGLQWTDGRWNPSISTDPNMIHYGWNSGFQCCNLVFLMGVRRIILLGFDMQQTGDKKHWFGDHPGALNKDSEYFRFAAFMDSAAPRFMKHGCEVINCSRETALKEYRRERLADCI